MKENHKCRKPETGKCCGKCTSAKKEKEIVQLKKSKIDKRRILDAGIVDYD